MRIQNKWIRGLITVIFIIFAFTSVYPLFWMFINSFKDTDVIMTGDSFRLPEVWKYRNYTDAIFERQIPKFFLNSVVVTACTLVLTIIVSTMLAYALTRMRWKLSGKINNLIMLGILLPSQIVIVPIFIMLRQMHLINNPVSLILTISAFNIAMSTIMASSFMKGIPFEMEEAAVMDGAGLFTILFRIIMPLIKPAIASMSINIFINSWNEFIYALVLITGEKYRTLPIALMNYSSGKYGTDYGGMFAAMVITSILPILLFLFFSNEVEKTLSAGAILK
ncbi:raffinose/stachyose/melibiose transport system permease protein [Anaerocolumna jejuensis DSM 15929]|uniref:Raffinose/stachyose/melibiose transport system permease protein n=1 Tax=Anaerocolumna jejuensis DSM 15929 TaxID=1121322 RepID=A0A1M6KVW3_9FIRM|nr:carbohydrate ABC transporter permease [Anaerocolumna jejuensis]SHJ63030.1 raffinose/stachyose/melibiose transport system permease protein [Anaerocolumna jejuensis DSM 15929]